MTPNRPAVAKLRRLRRSLTLLYAAGSAACLITLTFIAATIDTRSRATSLDAEVGGRADALARAVWMDKGVLHLDPLSEDELAHVHSATAVIQRPKGGPVVVRWLRTSGEALPGPAGLDALWAGTNREQEAFLTTLRGVDGKRLRWAGAPVWDADDIGAVVLAAADPEPGDRSHADLVRWLAASCAALVLAAAGAGHVLSGRSMRPALRTLEQQEQFLAEAAHELRTPLAVLRLVVEGDRTSPTGTLTAKAEALQLIDRLARLMDGLLSRARLVAGTRALELTPLRLGQLVEKVVDEVPRDGARISVDADASIVRGDPDLLAQAVRNLAENALRHGAAEGRPARVEVRVAAGTVTVRDHGPGIAADDRERIFDERVTDGRGGGIGIGLAIVRWVAELHGGTVRAGDAPGGGALIELMLPEHRP